MLRTNTLTYSLYDDGIGGSVTEPGTQIGDHTTSPGFVDEGNDDFTLAPGSACIDAGTATGAPSADYDGTTRTGDPDLGCYEAAACTEVTDAGSIASAQQNCGTFDPAAFTDDGAPNGSGGTLTYVWQTSLMMPTGPI